MNIYDALNEYKQYLLIEKKVSDNTLKNYMRDLEHFINYIQKQNQVVLINQIDKDMIRKYLQQFTSLAASSLSRKMVSLRSFYKFLMKEEIVKKNLMETFDLPKNTKRLPQVLNMEENNNIENEIVKENNNIVIEDEVIATIAGIAVSEVSGVAEMAGGFAGGITEVLSGKKNLAKGIKVETKEGETKIDVNIIVEYGVRIPDVAFEIQNKVKKSVEEKTGLKVSGVNVHIQGVKTEINEPQEIIVDGKNEEK